MIVSHRHRFIFFAVPKTATHSIREVLRLHKGEEDWEQQMLFGKQVLPIDEIAEIEHGHISAKQISTVLPAAQWSSYLKLAFVRNPYDRFVSACAFLNRGSPTFSKSSTEWMKVAMTRPQFRERVLIRPQVDQLMGLNNELAMDFIGRYETLQESLDYLLSKLSLPSTQLKVRNSSKHAHYSEYYDDDLREQVSEFYEDDLRHFRYSFDEPQTTYNRP